jgi:hypothetical protein
MSDAVKLSPPVDEQVFGGFVLRGWKSSGAMARAALIVACAIDLILFGVGANHFDLPGLKGFDGSLMLSRAGFVGLLVIGVLFIAATLIGTVVAGAVRFEAGVFAAAVGLIAVSVRGGTMLTTLQQTSGSQGVFFSLAFELLVLGVIVGIGWMLLWRIALAGFVRPAEQNLRQEPLDEENSSLVAGLTATAGQIVVTGLIVLFLCRSEQKNQALASVAAASFLGTVAAYKFAPARPSFWYWSGPILVGIIGYVMQGMTSDPWVVLGIPSSTFAGLVNPLPVDYAGAGVAASILAYWVMRTPDQPEVEESAETEQKQGV